MFSIALQGPPLQAGLGCCEDRKEYPCFRPVTLKDDKTPFAFEICSIYEMARCHDPTIHAAKEALLAVQEALPQASASFLPVISAQANHTNAYSTQGILFDENGAVIDKIGSYSSNVYTLALTQPILHFEHWQKYEQACDVVKQANATFAFAEQDLMIRTAQAYFGVLEAIDRLYFSTAQLKALKKFYDQTSERFKVGLIAITDVQIAKASHDNAVAQVINSRTFLSNQLEKLREIVGYRVEHLLPLQDELKLPPPEPNDPEAWVAVSLKQNFELQAQRYKTLAAREDIKITETGHLPTIDLNGQVQRVTPTNVVEFKGTTSQLSVQVNLPLFSGGSVISKTRQARHTFLQRDKETETLFRLVESNTRQFYLNVLTQISQVAAYKQAVISNQSALEATQASFNVGTRTIVDVLNAQTGLIQAQLNLATARYAYILQSLQLKRSAGILSPMDLCNINRWLKATPADAIIKTEDITTALELREDVKPEQDMRAYSIEEDTDSSIGSRIHRETIEQLQKEGVEPQNILLPPQPDTTGSSVTAPVSSGATVPLVPSTMPAPGSGAPATPGPTSPLTYPGTSTSPIPDKFNAMPTGVDSNRPHAAPPPPTQTNPSTMPGATTPGTAPSSPGSPSSPGTSSSSPGAKNSFEQNLDYAHLTDEAILWDMLKIPENAVLSGNLTKTPLEKFKSKTAEVLSKTVSYHDAKIEPAVWEKFKKENTREFNEFSALLKPQRLTENKAE